MRACRGGLGVSDAPDCAQVRAIDAYDLIHLEQHARGQADAVQGQVAHLAGDRRVAMELRPNADRVPQLNAAENALAGVLESMTLRGVEGARTARAFVVAREHAIDAMRCAAEEASGGGSGFG